MGREVTSGSLRRQRGVRRRLVEQLREDWRTNQPEPLKRPGFHVLAAYRFGRAVDDVRGPVRVPLKLLRTGLQFLIQTVYSVELPPQAEIGRRVVIGHLGGSVISPDAVIGDDCLIRQNVTIGAARAGGPSPRIGRGVEIGAGAVVMGDIEVGDGAIIGPNCVVSTDVPAGATVVAAPSRIFGGANGGLPGSDAAPSRTDPEDIVAVIRQAVDIAEPVEADTPLLSSGLIDSINLVVAIGALESTYGVNISADDVDAERFDTPRQIAEYVRARRS